VGLLARGLRLETELPAENRDHIVWGSAGVIEQFFKPGVECAMLQLRNGGF